MKAIRQSVRPKHQVLVLKCYPRYQKNAVDVKPNSSELSYLLYYVSTRRSKVQKVATFLEGRTSKDVGRARIWNVQVTLQILKALVEKSPRDLPLYAPYFLRILATVLGSKDLTMAEESVSTFETFCAHHEGSPLAADQDFLKLYEDVVRLYCSFATDPASQSKGPVSAPQALRWRKVGLLAVKAITSSEALSYDGGKLLCSIVPVILQNVYFQNESPLLVLQQRAHHQEFSDGEKTTKRRMSNATVQTSDTADVNPAAVAGSTADADKLAEEDIGLLALQSLKQIFVANGRGQVKLATAAALGFMVNKTKEADKDKVNQSSVEGEGDWATTLIEMVARWTPVQDRYVILVTAMETLLRSPVTEANMRQQILLAKIVGWLLRSNVNLIGLSVMDVLLGLVQHILLLLQLGGNDATVLSHGSQMGLAAEKATKEASGRPLSTGDTSNTGMVEIMTTASSWRIDLLSRLRKCVGDLATHIYYSDQISDMLSALLLRLKPSALVSMTSTAIENPVAAAQAISRSANLHERSDTDDFFSFETARITALRAIKDVLATANRRDAAAGVSVVGRNKVGIHVWEGTQWLLRDPNGHVRAVYVDALLTWLKLEMSYHAFRDLDPTGRSSKLAPRYDFDDLSGGAVSKRAVSSASNREKPKPARSTFLELLHLAVFDNAIQYADSEPDILLLHLLLTSFVGKLGINAVKSGLPMIVRLQEEIPDIDSPTGKVHLGSLVHGYFWALSEKFDFETSTVGRNIQAEIIRRKYKGIWLNKILLPAISVDHIGSPEFSPEAGNLAAETVAAEALKPYDGRTEMVDCIAQAYSSAFLSASGSPPGSPSRVVSMPILSSADPADQGRQLPQKTREQMLSTWSKEAVMYSCEKAGSKAGSLTVSKTGTNRSLNKPFLGTNGANGQAPRSRSHTPQDRHSRPPSHSPYGLVGGGLAALQKFRHSSALERSPTPLSSSSRSSTVRVTDLKKVLSNSGQGDDASPAEELASPVASSESIATRTSSASHHSDADDENDSPAEPNDAPIVNVVGASETHLSPETYSRSGKPLPTATRTSPPARIHSEEGLDEEGYEKEDTDYVPPVPPIPASLTLPGGYPLTPPLAEGTSDGAAIYATSNPLSNVPRVQGPPSDTGLRQKHEVGVNGASHPASYRSSKAFRRNAKGRSSDVGSWVSFGSSAAGTGSKVDVRELLGGIETPGPAKDAAGPRGGWARPGAKGEDPRARQEDSGVGRPPY